MSYSGWPTLKSRRTNAKLIMLYKIINSIVDIGLDGELMSSASHYTHCRLNQLAYNFQNKLLTHYPNL